jgi:hypothetical protein
MTCNKSVYEALAELEAQNAQLKQALIQADRDRLRLANALEDANKEIDALHVRLIVGDSE